MKRSFDSLNKKLTNITEGLTYDDILLLPGYSDFKRSDVSLDSQLHEKLVMKLPVFSAPMDTVTEDEMTVAMALNGGVGIIHRNVSIEDQADMVAAVKKHKTTEKSLVDAKGRLFAGAAVGAGDDLIKRIEALVKAGVDLICVDSGHGYTKYIMEATQLIKRSFPDVILMSGNVATYEGAEALIQSGADILRVGMGPGSICTTRIVTGMGVPQITAVTEAVRAASKSGVPVVADGGIRQTGDIAKALAIGAHAVMLGSRLARYDESPGDIIEQDGKKVKAYRGMGSIGAMKKGGAERYGQSRDTAEEKLIAEGVEGYISYEGSVSDYLHQIIGSLQASCYYIGARNLEEFYEKSRITRISQAGLIESHPHSITIEKTGGSYSLK